MIPYDDLVAALTSWRMRQGLPVTTTAAPGSGPTPTAIPNTGSAGYASGGSGGYAGGGYAGGGSGSYASGGSGGYASGGSGGYASGGSGATAMPGSGPVRSGPPSAPPRGGYQPPPLATPDTTDTNDEPYDVDDAALLEEAHYENEGADYGVSFGGVERDEESTTLGQAPSDRDSFGGETDFDPGAGSNKTRKPW